MGDPHGKHTRVLHGSHMGTLRGKTHGTHVENCCILQCAPLVAAHVWPHNGNHILAQHGQTHMGFMWVPCWSFKRQNTYVPRGLVSTSYYNVGVHIMLLTENACQMWASCLGQKAAHKYRMRCKWPLWHAVHEISLGRTDVCTAQ